MTEFQAGKVYAEEDGMFVVVGATQWDPDLRPSITTHSDLNRWNGSEVHHTIHSFSGSFKFETTAFDRARLTRWVWNQIALASVSLPKMHSDYRRKTKRRNRRRK